MKFNFNIQLTIISNYIHLVDKTYLQYKSFNFYQVVDNVIATLHAANNFFEVMKPWELKNKPEKVAELETIISLTMETLRQCSIVLTPIVPELSSKILNRLNVDEVNRMWSNLNISFKDRNSHEKPLQNSDSVLFKRIIVETAKDDQIRNKL